MLSELLPVLRSTYRTIDIRVILGKSKDNPSANWVCIFLKLRLTKETETELQQKFDKKLTELGGINSQFFRIVLFHRKIIELDTILDSIRTGTIFINGEEARILGNEPQTIFSRSVTVDSGYSTEEERAGNSHRIIYLRMKNTIPTTIESLGITKTDMEGLDVSQLHSWCDTGNLDNANSTNVVILFPIYCRIFDVPHRKLGNTSAIFEIHRLLIDGCKAMIMDENNKSIVKRIGRHNMKTISEGIDTVIVAFPSIPTEIVSQSILSVTVHHSSLGEIAYRRINSNDMLSPPFGRPLIDAFSLFRAKLALLEYSVSSNDKRQVAGITWLLTLVGFGTVNLSQFQNKDESTIDERHSADILAYNSLTDILLIIDCTVEIPEKKKVINIKNTAEFLARRLQREVIPVIFSSVMCQDIKPFSSSIGVVLLDKSNVELLCTTILQGNDPSTLFYSLIAYRP